MFRLYVTNPNLLYMLRPKTWELMNTTWQQVELRNWSDVLDADRQRQAARNKISKLERVRA